MIRLKSALEDVKVVEYGNFISVPYCGKLFADLGAEVIKIENPVQGDIARRRGPFLGDRPGPENSGLFLYLNTNKHGITLDLEKASGRDIFRQLINDADILIEDTKPGKMHSLGLDYNKLKSLNSSLIMTSITPFGQTGPYKDYKGCSLIGWHMGGAGFVTPRFAGTAEQEPLNVMHMADFISGMMAAAATLCALRVQRHTGMGQVVDISQLESLIVSTGYIPAFWPYEHRSMTRVSRPLIAPIAFLKCKDGWISIASTQEQMWQRFVQVMNNPEWAEEELFQDMYSRGEYWDSLEPLITEWTMKHTKTEIFNAAKSKKSAVAPVNSMSDVLKSQQLKERGFFVTIEHPKVGRLAYPGPPYKFGETPWAIRGAAPLLGQHNEEIYCDRLGYSKKDLVQMYEAEII